MDYQADRTIIIGDVHGCLAELEALITEVNYQPGKDRLFFVGDIINRGPHSYETFFRMIDLKGRSVLGNHEWSLLERHASGRFSERYLQLKGVFGSQFLFLLDEIARWPLYIETDDFILVHGGLVPGKAPEDSDPRILTNIRTWDGKGDDLTNPANPPWFDLYDGEKLVVFGHWAALEGVVRGNVIGLDTGCVYGKKLSALILPGREIVSVPAQQAYVTIGTRSQRDSG